MGGVKGWLAPTRLAPGLPQACPRLTLPHHPPPPSHLEVCGGPASQSKVGAGWGQGSLCGRTKKTTKKMPDYSQYLLGWAG